MTDEEKTKIENMRRNGLKAVKIAQELHLPYNTVKSYCRRMGITRKSITSEKTADVSLFCMTCGKKLERTVGKRPKKFCSDACRIYYWNNNRLERYPRVCPICGKEFVAKEKRTKYCCLNCYHEGRKGHGKSTGITEVHADDQGGCSVLYDRGEEA